MQGQVFPRKKQSIKSLLLFLFCLLLIYPAIRPLLKPGFFPSMDGHLHLYWAMQLKKSLIDGHFPVRWGANFFYGFGAPLFNFYQPLFHYLTASLTLSGISFLSATKIVLISSFILSALFMFLLAYEFWGPWGAAVSSLAYVFAPYQFVDVYVRGAFPEFLTFPLLPLIFWSFYKLSRTKKSFFFLLSSTSLALLPLTHNFLSIATLPFLFAFLLFLYSQRKSVALFLPFAFGLALSSFFWLPVILEKKYLLAEVLGLYWDFRDSFLYLNQLVYSPWGYGGSVKGPGDQMSFQIGFPHLALVFFSIFVYGKLKKEKPPAGGPVYQPGRQGSKILIFSLLSFLAAVLMTLPISIIIWELIPFFSYAYFPWRFLVLVVFFGSFISGSTIFLFSNKSHQKAFALLAILSIITLNSSFARPKELNPNDKDSNYQNQVLGLPRNPVVGADFTPRWVQKKPNGPPSSKIIPKINEKEAIFKTHYYEFKVSLPSTTKFTINTFYFPGWKAFIDRKETKIKIPDEGTMQIKVPSGNHQVKIMFKETFIRKLADLVSVFSFILLIFLAIRPGLLTKIEALLSNLANKMQKLQKSELWRKVSS